MTANATPTQRSLAMPVFESFPRRHQQAVTAEFAIQPPGPAVPLAEADLADLPAPARRYVIRSGAVGRPRPRNVRIAFDARMWRKPGQAPFRATSVQYNFFGRPGRLFLMKARMFGLPVRALHLYRQEAATFQVRIAGLVGIVDLKGQEMTRGETVTILNDICFFAPGALVDPRITWETVDDRSCVAHFTNGPYRISATLLFNDADELIDFWSDDRPAESGGALLPMRWSTPAGDYRDVDGMHLAHHGTAVYANPEGPYTYGEFTLASIAYDLEGPIAG